MSYYDNESYGIRRTCRIIKKSMLFPEKSRLVHFCIRPNQTASIYFCELCLDSWGKPEAFSQWERWFTILAVLGFIRNRDWPMSEWSLTVSSLQWTCPFPYLDCPWKLLMFSVCVSAVISDGWSLVSGVRSDAVTRDNTRRTPRHLSKGGHHCNAPAGSWNVIQYKSKLQAVRSHCYVTSLTMTGEVSKVGKMWLFIIFYLHFNFMR